MSETPDGAYAMFIIAALALVTFSAVGVGVMTGYIPSSPSNDSGLKATGPSKVSKMHTASASVPKKRFTARAPSTPAAGSTLRHSVTPEPVRVATAQSVCFDCGRVEAVNAIGQEGNGNGLSAIPGAVAGGAPRRSVYDEPVRVATAPSVCADCGRVEAVNAIGQKGEGSERGAIAGGVHGNQVGGVSGCTDSTVVGAEAYAGHETEKYANKTQRFGVVVRFEDGTSRMFSYHSEPVFRAGDGVKVVDGALVPN
jgi:outer membrane lipoprotein SlyB